MPQQGILGWPSGNPLGRFSSRTPLPGALVLRDRLTVPPLAADVNNWKIKGITGASILRISGTAARSITGIADGADGDVKIVENVGAYVLTFVNASASSDAKNRFALPNALDCPFAPGSMLLLNYDGASKTWRLMTSSVPGQNIPPSDDGAALGSTSLKWSDLWLASGAVINFASGDVTITHAADSLAHAGAANGYTFDTAVKPAANDGAALGTAALSWSDLFLASGGIINWANGTMSLEHVTGGLAISNGFLQPKNNDAVPLGDGTHSFSDLFLASGGVVNFGNGNLTLTHSAGLLTVNAGTNLRCTSGVLFGTDTAAANKLADYEEGAWTPSYATDGVNFTSVTYATNLRAGQYTKIGDVVHIQMVLATDARTVGSASGRLVITGLPFAVKADISGESATGSFAISRCFSFATNHPSGAYCRAGDTKMFLKFRTTANGAINNDLGFAELAAGATGNFMYLSGTYLAA